MPRATLLLRHGTASHISMPSPTLTPPDFHDDVDAGLPPNIFASVFSHFALRATMRCRFIITLLLAFEL